jgi:hypothetical protein
MDDTEIDYIASLRYNRIKYYKRGELIDICWNIGIPAINIGDDIDNKTYGEIKSLIVVKKWNSLITKKYINTWSPNKLEYYYKWMYSHVLLKVKLSA